MITNEKPRHLCRGFFCSNFEFRLVKYIKANTLHSFCSVNKHSVKSKIRPDSK